MGHEHDLQQGAEALQEVCLRIKNIIPSSERDFLAMGDFLAQVADRAGTMCESALTASQLLGIDRIKDITAKLRQILEAAGTQAAAVQADLRQNIDILRQMNREIETISTDLTQFSRTLKTLRVLGISTRIESSRFRDARFRFDSLADEVERSASVIESAHRRMCGQVGVISGTMSNVLTKAAKADSSQNANAALVLQRLHSSVDSLEQKQASASSAMDSLSARSKDVVASISEVILSLQFHDICRQQMEHVSQAIEELRVSLPQDPSQTACASAYRICRLQVSQLSYTKDTIFEAVERIIDSMDRIASSVDSLDGAIQEMLSADDERGESYLVRVEEETEHVLSLLNESRKTGNKLGDAIRSVTETSSSLSESVQAIREIVDDVKLLSLNARIKAAMAGSEGRSVSVLSEAIERLAGDMNKVSETLSHSFSMLAQGASALECRLAGSSDEDAGRLLSDLEVIRVESAETNGQAMGLLSRMREEGWRLADSIRTVTGNEISVHRTVRSSLEGIIAQMEGVIAGLRPLVGDDAAAEEAELFHLQDRYTMESERQIHQGQSVDVSMALYAQPDGFGDNVELF